MSSPQTYSVTAGPPGALFKTIAASTNSQSVITPGVVYSTLQQNTSLAAQGIPIASGSIVIDNNQTPPAFLGIADGQGNLATAGSGSTITAATVMAMINASIANLVVKGSSILNLSLTQNGANILTTDNITDVSTGQTQTAVNLAIKASIGTGGAGTTTPNVAPSIAFPGGTGDQGETATITPGTYTGTAPTSTFWDIVSNGTIVIPGLLQPSFVITAGMVTGVRALYAQEYFSTSANPRLQGKATPVYTLNAPAAFPVFTSPPSWGTGTPQVGSVYPVNQGASTNSPTSRALKIYRGFASLANPGTLVTTLSGTGTYTIQAADAGATLGIVEVDTNVTGSSSPTDPLSFSSTIVIQTSGGAPQWIDSSGNTLPGAILPSFLAPVYAVGDVIVIDLGVTVGNVNPNGYNIVYQRDGIQSGMPSASQVANLNYTVLPADSGHIISAVITPSSVGGGTGLPVTIAGVLVSGVSAGGGGGGSGSLTVSQSTLADNLTGTANVLSSLGASDWQSHTNGHLISGFETKSGGPNRITATVPVGTPVDASSSTWSAQWFSWTGGTPDATGNSSGAVSFAALAGTEIDWTVTGIGTSVEVFSIYVVISPTDSVSVTASLSDGSAPNASITFNPGANWTTRIDVSAKAGAANQSLTVKLVVTTAANPWLAQATTLT